ncbi:MAG TPA: anhydro-N-acetylmuramic acid kinase [Aggregatilineales bacterium]|nr:anhydro-N-acetylmuramic acid kinase [Aggregatilineales bacterium]
MYILGMISGTSADAIETALVEINGAPPTLTARLIKHLSVAYDPALQSEIFACFRPETSSVDRLSRLNVALGDAYAAAALEVIQAAGFKPEQVDLIGSHGQTLWYDAPGQAPHSPYGNVLALGEPAVIAERTSITTISGFRSRDIAAGGFGAPLVSYMDWLLFRHATQARAIVNVGGIANVTILPPLSQDTQPIAFDTGPGNMLMDDAVVRATQGKLRYDQEGLIAARGTVNRSFADEVLAHPYFSQNPPKTTGRELFGSQFGAELWSRAEGIGLSNNDLIATLTSITAQSIVRAVRDFAPTFPAEVFVAGGGAHNPILMQMLADAAQPMKVAAHDVLGIPSTAKESVLFALLAHETWHNRPGVLTAFTKATHAAVLGNITSGRLVR